MKQYVYFVSYVYTANNIPKYFFGNDVYRHSESPLESRNDLRALEATIKSSIQEKLTKLYDNTYHVDEVTVININLLRKEE